MEPGAMIDLDVTSVAHGGVFVGRHEGRVVFVPDAIPGERVRVRLTRTGDKSFWRGETVEVLDASPHRRPHVWPAADVAVDPERRPGGADFGHIDLDHQRELKRQVLREALQRFAGINADPPMRVPSGEPDGTRWRTRVGLHVDEAGRIGPFAARSHTVVEVDQLPLAVAEIEEAMAGLSADAGLFGGRIDLVRPADGRVRIIPRPPHDRTDKNTDKNAGKNDRKGARKAPGRHRPRATREQIVERVGTREFTLDASGFWQVHHDAAAMLTRLVAKAAGHLGGVDPDGLHLDLYGGVGLLAAALADAAGPAATGSGLSLITVESDPRAAAHAAQNLADIPGARAETGRIDRWLPVWAEHADRRERERLRAGIVVLDPPRSGAGAAVVRQLAALRPAGIVYVACDPVALARDLGTFRQAGYEASDLTAVDMFPHAHHLETVASLRPAAGALA